MIMIMIIIIVPFQAFADSSRGGIVERHYASCWICRSVWQ